MWPRESRSRRSAAGARGRTSSSCTTRAARAVRATDYRSTSCRRPRSVRAMGVRTRRGDRPLPGSAEWIRAPYSADTCTAASTDPASVARRVGRTRHGYGPGVATTRTGFTEADLAYLRSEFLTLDESCTGRPETAH